MTFNLNQAEWKELREESVGLADETRKLEQIVVGATGAVYAWIATHKPETSEFWILPWFIPALFAAGGALRSWAIGKHIDQMSDYLTTIESRFHEGGGWETHFASRRGYLHRTAAAFWATLLLITIGVPLLVYARCAWS